MSKLTTFSLTLLSTLVLASCSSGNKQNGTHPASKVNPQPQTPPAVQPQNPPATQPQKPKIIDPKIYQMDSEIFKQLNQYGNNYSGLRFVKLNLEGSDITVMPLTDKISVNHKSVETLRDNNGKLVGYYGYASITENTPRYIGSEEIIPHNHFIPLLNIDKNLKAVEPTKNVKYYGKMFYHYVDRAAHVLAANVVASYSQQNKRLAMLISNENETWTLGEKANIKDVALNTQPDSKDNIVGKLFINRQPKGEFVGGIFGSQGEVLVGQAKSIEDNGREAWKGVVGAKATEK